MIGVDIVDLRRIRLTDPFIRKVLTEKELREYKNKKTEKKKREYLGGRFAAKEAIYKATQDPSYLSYPILNKEDGRPYVEGHPEIEVSISHDGDTAIAMVLIRKTEENA